MTWKIQVKVKGHYALYILLCQWSFIPNMERIHPDVYMLYSGQEEMCHTLAIFVLINSWLTDLKAIGQDQRSLCAILVLICAQYGNNSSRTVCAVERTQQDVPYFSRFLHVMAEWSWRYRSSSKIVCATYPLMLVIICALYGKNPSWTVEVWRRTWRTGGRADGWTEYNKYIHPPNNFVVRDYYNRLNNMRSIYW